MDPKQPTDALNRLLQILYRSLPVYLHGKQIWSPRGREEIGRELEEIAADYRMYVEKIVSLVYDGGGCVDPGQFPLDFTSMHDLSVEYLFRELVRRQGRDVAAIERCVDDLETWPEARSLAEEVLGNARGHLDNLEELAAGGQPVIRHEPQHG